MLLNRSVRISASSHCLEPERSKTGKKPAFIMPLESKREAYRHASRHRTMIPVISRILVRHHVESSGSRGRTEFQQLSLNGTTFENPTEYSETIYESVSPHCCIRKSRMFIQKVHPNSIESQQQSAKFRVPFSPATDKEHIRFYPVMDHTIFPLDEPIARISVGKTRIQTQTPTHLQEHTRGPQVERRHRAAALASHRPRRTIPAFRKPGRRLESAFWSMCVEESSF